jgi:hypothetical protein
MTPRRVWHLWPARNWPASPAEEVAFVADLQALAAADRQPRSPTGRPARHDTTAVLNALRCGLTARELTAVIPGTPPGALLHAYRDLHERLAASVTAWQALLDDPTQDALVTHAQAAAVLMPVPVYRLATVAAHAGASALAATAEALARQVAEHARLAAVIEEQLATRALAPAAAVELGTRLHNPSEPALWGSPYFLPTRVTCLSPPRVADLLEERTTP